MSFPSLKTGTSQGCISYTALCVVITLTMLLNMSQIYYIETGTRALLRSTSSRSNLLASWNDNAQESTFSYFQNVKRRFTALEEREAGIQKDFVKPGDFIYYHNPESWDAAPIVVEQYKLIFFTIPKCGCTVWKQLFRRMMGYADWNIQDGETTFLPHNSELNGLSYLYDYSVERASEMMTSPDWTRAIMVREPKQRFLSAFLDKAVSNDHKHIIHRCCRQDGSLLSPFMCEEAQGSAAAFLKLAHVCEDNHWRPQHSRMEPKYWPYIDVVLHVETAYQDAKALLERLGAWDEYGVSGWGRNGQSSIFASTEVQAAGEHATWANFQHWKWLTPDLEEEVERFYMSDYENPLFNFTRGVCLTCETRK